MRKPHRESMDILFLSSQDDPDILEDCLSSPYYWVRREQDVSCLPLFHWHQLMLDKGFDYIVFPTEGGEEMIQKLPVGVYPQAAEETVEEFLLERDLLPNQFSLEDYMTGRLAGHMTEDLYWDPTQMNNIWVESIDSHYSYEAPNAEALFAERLARKDFFGSFLRLIRICCEQGKGPALSKDAKGWRFRESTYRQIINPATWEFLPGEIRLKSHSGTVTVEFVYDVGALVQAAWRYFWIQRRRWLDQFSKVVTVLVNGKARQVPRPDRMVWLSEEDLSCFREVFRKFVEKYHLNPELLNFREEVKPTREQKLQARIAKLNNDEAALMAGLGPKTRLTLRAAKAIQDKLDEIMAARDLIQSQLETAILWRATQQGWDKKFLGYDIMGADISPSQLEYLVNQQENWG